MVNGYLARITQCVAEVAGMRIAAWDGKLLCLCAFVLLNATGVAQQRAPGLQYTAQGELILNNQYIINMTKAGLSTNDLASMIAFGPNNFEIASAETLVRLHVDDKVPTKVLVVMANRNGSAAALKAKADFLKMPVAASDPPRVVRGAAVSGGGNRQAAAPVAPPPTPAGKRPGLENRDIYEMVAKGVAQETIVRLIQSSPNNFRLYADADFNEAHAKVPDPVLKVMAEAAGPRSVAAGKQWVQDRNAQASEHAANEQVRVSHTKAEIARQCPGCLAVIFYEYNAKTRQMTPAITWKLRDYLAAFGSLEYAKQHHIFVTNDPKLADYIVLEAYDDGVLKFRSEHYESAMTVGGEPVTLDMGQQTTTLNQEYYAMYVLDMNRKELFKTRHNRLGLWKEHDKADVDCWSDTEKFLHKLVAEQTAH